MSAPTRLLLSTAAFSACLGFGACSLLSPSDHGATTSPSSKPEKHPIRVDSVGYVTDRAKVATIVLTGTAMLADNTAEVRSAADDSLAWKCDVTGPTTDPDTASVVYVADFSPFTTPGSYYIATPGVLDATGKPARSASFQIAADVFRDTLTRAMIGFYGQRCGTAVHIALDKQTWSHAICHQQDASQKYSAAGHDGHHQAEQEGLARRRRLRQVRHQRRLHGGDAARCLAALPAHAGRPEPSHPRARRRHPRLPRGGEVGARLAAHHAAR